MQQSITPPSAVRTGVWVGIGAIVMSFAAYTSAMVVRQGSLPEWHHFKLPPILYWNALVLMASSVTLELARQRIGGPFDRLGREAASHAWLAWYRVTVALSFVFLVGQYLSWRRLSSEGLYLATSPSSAFFYVLTALHALHLLGGIGALLYMQHRLRVDDGPRPVELLSAVAVYWHFMAVLWLYLLVILALWV
ncbi:MAG: cytochrome c oxidase subunit 3 [Gemmatimonadaceae bacterium]